MNFLTNEKPKTVCIVGHGPSPVGKGLGAFVDEHDIVIRMTEWGWQTPEDYGDKYDIGVYCKGPSEQFVGREKVEPRLGYWRYKNNKETSDKLAELNIWPYAKSFFNTKKLSRGTAVFVAAIQIFNCERITLFGFDAIQNGQYDKKHHHSKFKQFMQYRKVRTNTHDWKAEKRLINTLIHEYNLFVRWMP